MVPHSQSVDVPVLMTHEEIAHVPFEVPKPQFVDKIIEVARHKAAPLSAIGDTVTAMRKTNPEKQNSGSSGSTELDPNSPHHRRLQQLLLYMRCLHILSQTLDLSRAELKAKKLKPSTSVKNSKLLSYHIFGMRPS